MQQFLERLNSVVWGIPLVMLICGVGIFLSVKTGFIQLRLFPKAIRMFFAQFKNKEEKHNGEITPYRALCTALAATAGTGNLAGVAGAIAIGGPGVIFWMWVSALLGMAIKFAEASLAVKFRIKTEEGSYAGGTMHMIERGLGKHCRFLAYLFCIFGVIASFGIGNATQINTVVIGVENISEMLGAENSFVIRISLAVIIAILMAISLSGGAVRIGSVAEQLVPAASVCYLLLSFAVLALNASNIPRAFSMIINGAFSPKTVTCGMVGSIFITLRVGVSRGVFTNEAGMGTAGIAHSGSSVSHPVEQGMMGIMEVFLDTIVICTMTGLVIICSGISVPYGVDSGVLLTMDAFRAVCGQWVVIPLTVSLVCFAVATILGWGLYGLRCAEFLFGKKFLKIFVLLQFVVTIIGAIANTGAVWLFSDIVNGLMAVPNLIALFLLSPELLRLVSEYTSA